MSFIFLTLLIMHYCTFVIIGPDGGIGTQVAEALAPFDETLEVDPYKIHLDEEEIKRMAGHYGLEENDVSGLITKMPDWRGTDGGVDDVGLFSWATTNPEGKWDWYEIGGRWNGYFHGRNVIKAKSLLKSPDLKVRRLYSIVSPDGEWHEVEKLINTGFFKFDTVKKSDSRWLIELKQVLSRFPEHRVVCVDMHR